MIDMQQAALLARELGPPPLAVNSKNRGTARRWCRAVGIASRVVENLTTAQLASAYNDTQALAELILKDPPARPLPPPADRIVIDRAHLEQLIESAVSDALAARGEPLTELRVLQLIGEALGVKTH